MLRAGSMDREVTIARFSVTLDAHNQPEQAWADVATVSASWRRASARETLAAAQVNAIVTDIFEMWWSEEIRNTDPKDRLRYDGQIYDIAAVEEIGRREGIRITASRRASGTSP